MVAYDAATCSGVAQFVPSAIESVGACGMGIPRASAYPRTEHKQHVDELLRRLK
jgi:hypothetical protein